MCYHQAITSDILTITYANYVVMKQHTYMPVAKTQGMQACAFVTSHQHPTNRNAGYSSVESVCMSVILVPDQQPRHYFHRVSRHLYHYTCLIMWNRTSIHVKNQDSRHLIYSRVISVTASRDYQAILQYPFFFKVCSETAGMFVTYISVRFASTFVVVNLSQQVYLLHLPQTRSHVSYNCT